jgi:hypothetical protein
MKKLLTLLAVPAAFAMGACEQRDYDRDGDRDVAVRTDGVDNDNIELDRDARGLPDLDYTKQQETTRDMFEPGRGEGELEKSPTVTTPAARGEGEREGNTDSLEDQLDKNDGMTNAQVIAAFQSEMANDADIKAVTRNIRLEERGDSLVLTGTVPSHDVGDAIEDYAQKLADRMVNNELEIDRALDGTMND